MGFDIRLHHLVEVEDSLFTMHVSEEEGTKHVLAKLSDIPRPRNVEESLANNSVDKVVMGARGVYGYDKAEYGLAVKVASYESPCVELATYKLSLRGGSY